MANYFIKGHLKDQMVINDINSYPNPNDKTYTDLIVDTSTYYGNNEFEENKKRFSQKTFKQTSTETITNLASKGSDLKSIKKQRFQGISCIPLKFQYKPRNTSNPVSLEGQLCSSNYPSQQISFPQGQKNLTSPSVTSSKNNKTITETITKYLRDIFEFNHEKPKLNEQNSQDVEKLDDLLNPAVLTQINEIINSPNIETFRKLLPVLLQNQLDPEKIAEILNNKVPSISEKSLNKIGQSYCFTPDHKENKLTQVPSLANNSRNDSTYSNQTSDSTHFKRKNHRSHVFKKEILELISLTLNKYFEKTNETTLNTCTSTKTSNLDIYNSSISQASSLPFPVLNEGLKKTISHLNEIRYVPRNLNNSNNINMMKQSPISMVNAEFKSKLLESIRNNDIKLKKVDNGLLFKNLKSNELNFKKDISPGLTRLAVNSSNTSTSNSNINRINDLNTDNAMKVSDQIKKFNKIIEMNNRLPFNDSEPNKLDLNLKNEIFDRKNNDFDDLKSKICLELEEIGKAGKIKQDSNLKFNKIFHLNKNFTSKLNPEIEGSKTHLTNKEKQLKYLDRLRANLGEYNFKIWLKHHYRQSNLKNKISPNVLKMFLSRKELAKSNRKINFLKKIQSINENEMSSNFATSVAKDRKISMDKDVIKSFSNPCIPKKKILNQSIENIYSVKKIVQSEISLDEKSLNVLSFKKDKQLEALRIKDSIEIIKNNQSQGYKFANDESNLITISHNTNDCKLNRNKLLPENSSKENLVNFSKISSIESKNKATIADGYEMLTPQAKLNIYDLNTSVLSDKQKDVQNQLKISKIPFYHNLDNIELGKNTFNEDVSIYENVLENSYESFEKYNFGLLWKNDSNLNEKLKSSMENVLGKLQLHHDTKNYPLEIESMNKIELTEEKTLLERHLFKLDLEFNRFRIHLTNNQIYRRLRKRYELIRVILGEINCRECGKGSFLDLN